MRPGVYLKLVESELEKLKYSVLIRDNSADNGERTFIGGIGNKAGFHRELLDSVNVEDYSDLYVTGYQIYGKDGTNLIEWLTKLQCKRIFFAPGSVITMLDKDLLKKMMGLHPVLHLNDIEAIEYTKASSVVDALYDLYFQ